MEIKGRLENWSVVVHPEDTYLPPEVAGKYVSGAIYGDVTGRWEDGHRVTTSRLAKAEGKFITTNSGSVYELGEPDPEYIAWCQDVGVHVPTPEEPIKVHNG